MLQLRPSASHIWTNCDAYARFVAELPEEPPSDPAREGTCAAWVAETVLRGEASCAADLVGATHENGWLVEQDMTDLIQKYVDHLKAYGGEIHVERKVTLNQMIAGTPDAFAVAVPDIAGCYTLYVDDLKYGYDIVEAYRNPQVSIYAGAIMKMLTSKVKIKKVVIGIYQPRAFHPAGIHRTWQIWPEQLMAYVREIEAAGHRNQAIDSRATPGYHCEHCPAAATCAALATTVYKGFRVATDERQGHMTADQMAEELRFLEMMGKMLKARASAVRAEATARMKRSEHIPGWGFEEKFGNKKFTVDPEIVKALTGKDPYEKPKVCTPAELIRRGANPETVDRITTRPRIPPKLVPLDRDHYKRLFAQKDNG